MRLISHSLTPELILSGILSLIDVGNLSTPRSFSALPPVNIFKASPKAISGRTSYIRVRLEFLRYPHLIHHLFNGGWFGPPWSFTSTSTWTWIGHPVSGPMHTTNSPYSDSVSLRLRTFRFLTLLHTYARRTILQKVPYYTLTCCRCL